MAAEPMQRYSVITEKNPREIVLLRGTGCTWRRCRFCDYHLDCSADTRANAALNRQVLSQVTGAAHQLEVINSGSFSDLDEETVAALEQVCVRQDIRQIHFECHWRDRAAIPALRRRFADLGVTVKVKTGVETFDALFRECYLDKGIDETNPAVIAAPFDEVCLLQGIPGQTAESMKRDIDLGLRHFERVCVNIMTRNSSRIAPDPSVIRVFKEQVLPVYAQNDRVDILMENTDFGVGGPEENKQPEKNNGKGEVRS